MAYNKCVNLYKSLILLVRQVGLSLYGYHQILINQPIYGVSIYTSYVGVF